MLVEIVVLTVTLALAAVLVYLVARSTSSSLADDKSPQRIRSLLSAKGIKDVDVRLEATFRNERIYVARGKNPFGHTETHRFSVNASDILSGGMIEG